MDIAIFAAVGPRRWVAHFGVDIAQGDGEVDVVEVEVVDLEVGELFARNGLDAVLFGECAPEFGDDEEVFTLYEAILDSAGEAFAGFLLVTVVYEVVSGIFGRS